MDNVTRKKLKMIHLGIQFLIAVILSLVMTIINFGFKEAFFYNWGKSFVVAFLIIPLALRLIPIVAKGVISVIGNCPLIILRSLVSVCVAALMEGIVSFAVTFAQYGFDIGWPMMWANTFVKALPVGLLIGFTMTFIVHPRLHKMAVQTH